MGPLKVGLEKLGSDRLSGWLFLPLDLEKHCSSSKTPVKVTVAALTALCLFITEKHVPVEIEGFLVAFSLIKMLREI